MENELKEKNKTIENLEKEVEHLKNELDKQIEINKDCELVIQKMKHIKHY